MSSAITAADTDAHANAFRRSEAHAHIKINTATAGYIAADLNNFSGDRTVEEGSLIVIHFATLADDGPSGGFFNDAGSVPW